MHVNASMLKWLVVLLVMMTAAPMVTSATPTQGRYSRSVDEEFVCPIGASPDETGEACACDEDGSTPGCRGICGSPGCIETQFSSISSGNSESRGGCRRNAVWSVMRRKCVNTRRRRIRNRNRNRNGENRNGGR